VYKSTSPEDYIKNVTKLAKKAFKKHKLHKQEEKSWIIRNTKNSAYWVEIVILAGEKILAHGDINAIILSSNLKDKNAKEIINWAATSHISYLQEKALIGMGLIGVTVTDIEVAMYHLNELLEIIPRKNIPDIRNAIDDLNRDNFSPSDIRNNLYNTGIDPEFIHDIGKVVSPRVIYAHEATKKLVSLLEEKENKNG
jgi:hypothetical protein